jgi:hypothetical protein
MPSLPTARSPRHRANALTTDGYEGCQETPPAQGGRRFGGAGRLLAGT